MPRPVVLAAALLTCAATASAQSPAGAAFQVNVYTPSWQMLPRVALAPNGDFTIVWQSLTQDGSDWGVYARSYAADGTPLGAEFRVNSYTAGIQEAPHIAVNRRGDFVVVWDDEQDGMGRSISARRYGRAGTVSGAEFQVNLFTTGFQYGAQAGFAVNGEFVVNWTTPDGNLYGIGARRFSAAGDARGGEFIVNSHRPGVQRRGALAVRADGASVSIWTDESGRDGTGSGIFGRITDATGNPVGDDFQVNVYTTANQTGPSVGTTPDGSFVVAWGSMYVDGYFGWGTAARRFDAAGTPIGGEFLVNVATTGSQVPGLQGVAQDHAGNFVIAWGDDFNREGYLQRFDAAGARRGPPFRLNINEIVRPSVSSDPVGNLVLTWDSFGPDGSGYGVFARRFGGLRPAALAVLDGGNDVLDVPDNFALTTSWHNFSGVGRSFQGHASQFTGPPGLVYALGSTTASYSVADGATASCAGQCISGSLTGARPPGHVDVSVRESIVPDSLGQVQTWVLHVGGSFTDSPASSPFYRFVETLLHRGVTAGCSATLYCSASATTREQMAVFVLVAKEGTAYVPPACGAAPMFADVPPASPFCRWVEELARRGVVSGCGGGNYCPAADVTREQMSVFVLRVLDPALNPPACGTPMFTDVPATNPFCRWIEELARRGVVTGCGGGNYCPLHPVTREQMGVFISVTFGLTLYGP
jgi:hypothetical protein